MILNEVYSIMISNEKNKQSINYLLLELKIFKNNFYYLYKLKIFNPLINFVFYNLIIKKNTKNSPSNKTLNKNI